MPNISQRSIIKVDKDFLEMLYTTLLQNGGVKITGFGMFTLTRTKGIKNGMNPYSLKRMNVPPFTKIKFRPVKKLRDTVQKWK